MAVIFALPANPNAVPVLLQIYVNSKRKQAMFYSSNRDQLRQKFFDAYNKHQSKQALDGIEQIIINVISQHPEYLELFEKQGYYINKDYSVEMGETNPFLHMSSHIGLHEQLSTNRPKGITKVYQDLLAKTSTHEVEHQMIDIMMEVLWQAQRDNTMPDEKAYLKKLKKLLKG